MNMSRSELHRRNKENRKKKTRRLLAVNVTMLGALIVLVAVWFSIDNPFAENSRQAAAGQPSPSAPADTVPAETAGGETGGDGAAGQPGQAAEEPDGVPAGQDQQGGSQAEGTPDHTGIPQDGSSVNLAFVGDILLGASVADMIASNGYDYPYKQAKLYLSDPDITAGNLEYPVTENGTPAENKTYVFKGSPDALPALKDSGLDLVTLANNHTLDQGVEGLLDTMKHLDEAGIQHVGAGHDDMEAFQPVIIEKNGIKIAYIGLSKVVPDVSWKADKNKPGVAETYDTTRAVAAIKSAKEQADLVVVMVHWGVERSDKPEAYQRDFAKQYIDAGADLIIGSHPHVLQGFEMYKGKWIAYSLGNFIFSAYPKGAAGETGVLGAECTKGGDCQLQFYPMSGNKAQPAPMEQPAAEALLARIESISYGVHVNKDGVIAVK
ncbi:CapA family protein [Paenibacillus protaetiae]|uniref:CapA family protein n=1 Tax=Paenibacillus protaetiae TaxID=2509456 RepID=A0A4V0YF44_9BACL|nr:CapA family protein [Paenibacillus protaetiae]QAY66421.1 CapA family protein [Paenibacillus protaetiae]